MRRLNVNVAASPFVNRPVLMAVLGVAGGLAVLLTVLNLVSFILLGRGYREGRDLVKSQEQRLSTLEKDIVAKQALMGSAGVATFSHEAVFLDGVLKEKRFSWVDFLEGLEKVKPYGTAFQSIQPTVTPDGAIRVALRGEATQRAELFKLENNLFGDPHFREVTLQSEKQGASTGPYVQFAIAFEYVPDGAGHAS